MILAIALGATACSRRTSTSTPTSTPTPTSTSTSTTRTCEVEIAGRLTIPDSQRAKAQSNPPIVLVAIGDCLDPGSRVVGMGGSTNGRFFVEVFVPWGSDLTLCAVSEPALRAPSTLYGKAAKTMHAEGDGEVEFRDVTVELTEGSPRVFPRDVGP